MARMGVGTIAAMALLAMSCSGSDYTNPNTLEVLLHYDGIQDDSPNLTGNRTYEAAARFTPAETGTLVGGELTAVQFYINTVPDSCKVKIYGEGTASTPGGLLYSAVVIASGMSWNEHVLGTPLPLPSGDLWLSIEFTDANTQQTMGCDPGPAVANGRFFLDSNVGTWTTFAASINWNVRGVVEVPI